MLAALCCVLRVAFVDFPNIKPITALFFIFSLYLGLADSLIIMALTMLLTGVLLGFSPIILGQILVYALLLLLFWLVGKKVKNVIVLAFLAGSLALIYGALISVISGLIFGFGAGGYLGYWLAGLVFDLAHALSTLLFYPVIVILFRRINFFQNKF